MSLTIRFWGTRGSIPSPGVHSVRYGGNTPCVEVLADDGSLLIMDAGTGLRELGRSLAGRTSGSPVNAEILLSHTHSDHIQGIPFFAPLYGRGNHFTIRGNGSDGTSVEAVVRSLMTPALFPVGFERLEADVDFRGMDAGRNQLAGFEVNAFGLEHPGGSTGYRIESLSGGGTIAYATDNELQGGGELHPVWREGLVEWMRGSSVLVHDATYTEAEYDLRRGWGHSTYRDAVELAIDADVGTLVLFHHNPDRGDDELDECLKSCRRIALEGGTGLQVIAAAEGMTIEV